jgi:hypothetical protein
MYRKFDVTENLLIAQYFFFFEKVNLGVVSLAYSSAGSAEASPLSCTAGRSRHGRPAAVVVQQNVSFFFPHCLCSSFRY